LREVGPLGLDEAAAGGIGAADDGINEGAPGGEVGEVTMAAQQQRLAECVLEVAVRRVDRAVLVGDAGVVAGRAHVVVGAERLVAACLILGGVAAEVAEGGGEAVGPVLQRRAAERPEGILQPLGEGGEALAAEHHAGVLPAGEGEAEMVEPVFEQLAGDADAERGGLGEVGQPLPPRRMVLAEDHLARRAGDRLPVADPPLQRAADADGEIGMAAVEFLEQRDRPQARGGLQHRHDLAVPDRGKQVGPAPAAGRRPFGGRAGIGLDPPAGAGAEARHGGRGGAALGASERHIAPRLVVGDVRAGQAGDPPGMTAHSGTPHRHGTPP
jgi:hypothetical protein